MGRRNDRVQRLAPILSEELKERWKINRAQHLKKIREIGDTGSDQKLQQEICPIYAKDKSTDLQSLGSGTRINEVESGLG
jgi:hypothetical protein